MAATKQSQSREILQVANDENDNDVGIDLSSNDESSSNGGGHASPQYNPMDPESSEDPACSLVTQACTHSKIQHH